MKTIACPVCMEYKQRSLERAIADDPRVDEYELCTQHQELYNDGYIALVGVDMALSIPPYTPDTVSRTGAFAHVKADKVKKIFKMPVDDAQGRLQPIAFVPDELIFELAEIKR